MHARIAAVFLLGILTGSDAYLRGPLTLRSPALPTRFSSSRRPVNGLSLLRAQQKPFNEKDQSDHVSMIDAMMDSLKQASAMFKTGDLQEEGTKKGDWPSILTIPVNLPTGYFDCIL
jgi:hypothetical protein